MADPLEVELAQRAFGELSTRIAEAAGCDRCVPFIVDDSGTSLVPRFPATGVDEHELAAIDLPEGFEGFVGGGRALRWSGEADSPLASLGEALAAQEVVLIPLTLAGSRAGVVCTWGRAGLSDVNLSLLEMSASEGTAAIDALLMFERQKRLVEGLRGLEAAATRLRGPDGEAVLRGLVEGLTAELGSRRATVWERDDGGSPEEVVAAGGRISEEEPELVRQVWAGADHVVRGERLALRLEDADLRDAVVTVQAAARVDDTQVDLVTSLIRQASAALSSVRAAESAERHASNLAALFAVANAVGELGTRQETFERLVETVADVLGADACVSVLSEPRQQELRLGPTTGLDDAQLAYLRSIDLGSPDLPVVSRVQETFAPEMIADAASSDLLSADAVRRLGVRSMIVIPLARWRQTLGILLVLYTRGRMAPTESDRALIGEVARQATLGAENAYLHRDLQLRLEALTRLHRARERLLGKTDTDDLLQEVAAAGTGLLECPAAAVMFLDREQATLGQVAEHGLGGAAAAITALPVSSSLEGRAVVARAPQRSNDLSSYPVAAAAALRAEGLTSAIAVSLIRHPGVAVGSLTFFSGTRPFLPEDAEVARAYSATVALALENARRHLAQTEVVRAFHTALVPKRLPEFPGVDIAVRFVPSLTELEVGGDFYDAFETENGGIAFAVGDVSGKGPEAAGVTVMAKYMLRAFALRNPAPASVCYRLNNALVRSLPEEKFLTLVYGVYHPADRRVELAVAGGWKPRLLRRGQSHVVEQSGSLIGAFENQQYGEQIIEVGPGETLVLFTDGIPEARRAGEQFGADGIDSVLDGRGRDDAETVADALLRAATGFAGGALDDEAVVMAIRFRAAG